MCEKYCFFLNHIFRELPFQRKAITEALGAPDLYA